MPYCHTALLAWLFGVEDGPRKISPMTYPDVYGYNCIIRHNSQSQELLKFKYIREGVVYLIAAVE